MAEPPRVGFLGVGWIGRHRMQAAHQAGALQVAAVADTNTAAAQDAAAAVGCTTVCADLETMLDEPLDAVVIATPTALHAEQVHAGLRRALPVFCQKPLGRTAAETRRLIRLACEADVLLGVDMSYRHLAAVKVALEALHAGAIGTPHAAELVFHNAYGPDKAWVRDPGLAGGGALIDLGCHLVDLARMFLGELVPTAVHADLFAQGRPLNGDRSEVEDLALAQVRLVDGRTLRIACSWWLPAGTDAVIEATFIGERGALSIRNLNGSFYDFEARLVHGRQSRRLAGGPDDWGGRALIGWARRLAIDASYDPDAEHLVGVAELLDRIYGRVT